ncbi:MAG: transporter substrate-binding domain-containing protein [Thermodesulfobacteriota bacterium]
MKRIVSFLGVLLLTVSLANATTLEQVKENGVLKHLGVYYANFNTGAGDGMDSELMQMFAEHLGVKYEHVEATFATVLTDLSGIKFKRVGKEVEVLGHVAPKGDVIANGLTILDWRKKVVDYSTPTFPTQVWLVAKADSNITPITPSGDGDKDIAAVKAKLKSVSVLSKNKTCLDASLYNLDVTGAEIKAFPGGLGELAPAVIQGQAETTLLDVPDALVALEKWGSEIKVIGPVSKFQGMGAGFSKDAPKLREEFNAFLAQLKKDGRMHRLVTKYYPLAFQFYPEFFEDVKK